MIYYNKGVLNYLFVKKGHCFTIKPYWNNSLFYGTKSALMFSDPDLFFNLYFG
jgi:hypothetical protein